MMSGPEEQRERELTRWRVACHAYAERANDMEKQLKKVKKQLAEAEKQLLELREAVEKWKRGPT
jgi:predicted  nucleic acid-binding Zn-ribbon protein